MAVRLGLVGLPNVGKSTLFNALTGGTSAVGNFPFTTKDQHSGMVPVPEPRLPGVSSIIGSALTVPAQLELVDIAGLVKGAAAGEGLGNRFLAHIREVDVVIHVVRAFHDPSVAAADDSGDPVTHLEVVETELLLSDLETLCRRKARLTGALKAQDRRAKAEDAAIDRLVDALNRGTPAREAPGDGTDADRECRRQLLTAKPCIVVVNTGDDCDVPADSSLADWAARRGAPLTRVNAKLAHELVQLEPSDRQELLGLPDSDPGVVITAACQLLGLVKFITANSTEARAWLIPMGTTAPQAAGQVHSDMERGFIACEVISAAALMEIGSWQRAREQGALRIEGARYTVSDGDVIQFRFNV